LSTLLRGLTSDTWDAQSRCTEWSVHEVVRHLCDMTLKATTLLRGGRPGDVDTQNMDPRTAPVNWLYRSAGEAPRDTLVVFEAATAELLAEVDHHLGAAADIQWLYGPVPWSIAALHVFWDAWVHERDILIPLGQPQDSPAVESRAAATYGLLMAGLPTLAGDTSLDETIVLAGDGGGVFRLEARGDLRSGRQFTMAGYPAEGTIWITVDDGDGAGREPELLDGTLVNVVDSLVGREPELTEALQGPPERVQRLSVLRAFMLSRSPEDRSD
jgi:uncharacterized protein (TIGR03083 family)